MVSATALAGLSVLVTRPAGQAAGILAAIAQAGGRATHCPALVISSIDEQHQQVIVQQTKQCFIDLDLYHHVIFISTNAVRFGLEWMDRYWPQAPVGVRWYAVGRATASALSDAGLSSQSPLQAMNSEALLALAPLQQIAGDKVLVVRGIGGREHLAEQLRLRDARVDYAECYQRGLPAMAEGEFAQLIDNHNINVICVNSGESLENICKLMGERLFSRLLMLPVIVPGQRVADIARERGFQQVEIAENASDEAMLEALTRLVN